MTATVVRLPKSAKPPDTGPASRRLKPGEAAQLLHACEARVRHAADNLESAVAELRELKTLTRRMRALDADVRARAAAPRIAAE
jgi:hypothetical protein